MKGETSNWIVGIGVSAGGLEALISFLNHLPENPLFSIIIAQHRSKERKSKLVSILGRTSNWSVEIATDGLFPVSGNVYVAPPATEISIVQGGIRLKKANSSIYPSPSINDFFESLAIDKKNQAIAIVLSGTGQDGSLGAKSVKSSGGIVIAQKPESAEYSGMPEATIKSGECDAILLPKEMGLFVEKFINDGELPELEKPNENSLERILKLLSDQQGVDFGKYKRNTISRRVEKRLGTLKISTHESYLSFLKKNPEELDNLFQEVLIGVTEFFRNEEAFNSLRNHLESMLSKKKIGDSIRLWSIGCATGEEAYSMMILLYECLGEKASHFNIQMFATDIDTEAINFARKGIYPDKAVSKLDESLKNKYFDKKNKGYEVKKTIRQHILFTKQDITSDPPFVRLDLILCRNLLIYFDQELQRDTIPVFYYALQPGALLFLGRSESIAHLNELFIPVDAKNRIFQRETANKLKTPRLANFRKMIVGKNQGRRKSAEAKINKFDEAINTTLLDDFEHPYLVVNDSLEVLEVYGNLQPYLNLTEGELNSHATKILNKDLHLELQTSFIKASRSGLAIKSNIVSFHVMDKQFYVQILVKPMLNAPGESDYFIIIFQNVPASYQFSLKDLNLPEGDPARLRIEELEHELAASKEHLHTFAEELETSNEELQSINEEFQSMNEELKSSNEELETSNKELQSTNEELQAANAELQIVNGVLIEREEQLKIFREEFKEKEEKLEEAEFIGKLGVWELKLKTGEVYWSSSLYEIFELEKHRKITLDLLLSMIVPENVEHFRNALNNCMTKGTPFHEEYAIITPNNNQKYIRSKGKPHINLKGEIEKIIGVTINITDHVLSQEKITEINLELKEKVQNLIEANKELNTFNYSVSHDLREPVRTIHGYAEFLKKTDATKLSPKGLKYLNEILKSTFKMSKIIDDLLRCSQIANTELRYSEINLEALVRESYNELMVGEKERKIELITNQLPVAYGDISLVRSAISNLISNAIKYTRSKQSAKLEVGSMKDSSGDFNIYFIKDNGIGFDEKFSDKIFKLFERLQPDTEYEGTGVGLAIVERIFQRHNGRVWAESQKKDGSTFFFTLPGNPYIL